ncbi:MAG TPA: ParB/RepB/Spo0J family partition protein [Persephonella sp.]|uniref:Putative ParB family protein n=1 Tax=Persephonella marina (strain DSM 14350 / EX-H1) TaxID=123214 RepID=C0QPK4_PERMH|nr:MULTISPECIES: ParB/RepB/Spo0J family partition protein [Persephonella]ACO03828.1 putative ParB family protein [Persephonella marina EX-H1]HCB69785.1 ParB/RepB/Spo0J family partition protein [Persephonella sp.]
MDLGIFDDILETPKAKKIKEIKQTIEEVKPEEIPISRIKSPRFHDRSYVSQERIASLAENIKEFGLAQPIVVRKLEDGSYERVIGYIRLKAFEYLGRDKIPAIVLDIDEETALALMISENAQREDLNDYDKLMSHLEYLSFILGTDKDEVIRVARKIFNYISGNIKELPDEDRRRGQVIEKTLQKLSGTNLRTFIERLKILNVAEEIKDAIKKYGWSYSLAIEVNKLRSYPDKMRQLIDEIIMNDLTKKEVEIRVREILGEEAAKRVKNPFKESFREINKKVSRIYSKLPEKERSKVERIIQKKLSEIEQLLERYEI